MTANPELWDALLPVVDAFEALGVRYCIGGSVASSFAGVTRATLDVDLVAELHMEHGARLAEVLAEIYYANAKMIGDAIPFRGSFNVIHLPTMFKIDIFIIGTARRNYGNS